MGLHSFFMTIIRLWLECISRIVYYIKYHNFEQKILPPVTNNLLLEPAVSLAEKIRSREVTSSDVVKAFIDRIKEVNPNLNAMVEPGFEHALCEANEADLYLSEHSDVTEDLRKNKPFFGVPFTLKETFPAKGFHQTAGIDARKDVISDDDGETIKRIKDAGAILLGTTNVPEAAMWWESCNTIYGATNNPYAFNRSAGGSSGGEGSLVSAAGSVFGIGSDVGGSIRIPSYFNGIFGHKSTSCATCYAGHYPKIIGKVNNYMASGPLARYAADLRPILKLLMSDSHRNLINLDKKVNFKDIKIYYMEDDGGSALTTPVDAEIKEALRKTVEHFRTVHNVPCIRIALPMMKEAGEMCLYKINEESSALPFCEVLANEEGKINLWKEIAKKCFCKQSVHTGAGLFYAVLSKLFNTKLRPSHYKSLMKGFDELERDFKEILVGNSIFLYPPFPNAAVYHNQSLFKFGNAAYTMIFNILGLPVTECPLGLNSSGLPLGVQVVGGPNEDGLCISVAEEIERAFGGWICPSAIKLL